jgi:hypothetical protein
MPAVRLGNLRTAPEAHPLSDEVLGAAQRLARIHVEGMACEEI